MTLRLDFIRDRETRHHLKLLSRRVDELDKRLSTINKGSSTTLDLSSIKGIPIIYSVSTPALPAEFTLWFKTDTNELHFTQGTSYGASDWVFMFGV